MLFLARAPRCTIVYINLKRSSNLIIDTLVVAKYYVQEYTTQLLTSYTVLVVVHHTSLDRL